MQSRSLTVVRGLVLMALTIALIGCGSSERQRVKVAGTVKYSDGSIPQGEVAVIRFEPASLATGQADPQTKAASGTIAPDGSFQLSTLDENDGAFPGEYKVVFTIKAKYDGASPNLVAPQYASAATSPLTATVKPDSNEPFNFTIEKAQ